MEHHDIHWLNWIGVPWLYASVRVESSLLLKCPLRSLSLLLYSAYFLLLVKKMLWFLMFFVRLIKGNSERGGVSVRSNWMKKVVWQGMSKVFYFSFPRFSKELFYWPYIGFQFWKLAPNAEHWGFIKLKIFCRHCRDCRKIKNMLGHMVYIEWRPIVYIEWRPTLYSSFYNVIYSLNFFLQNLLMLTILKILYSIKHELLIFLLTKLSFLHLKIGVQRWVLRIY